MSGTRSAKHPAVVRRATATKTLTVAFGLFSRYSRGKRATRCGRAGGDAGKVVDDSPDSGEVVDELAASARVVEGAGVVLGPSCRTVDGTTQPTSAIHMSRASGATRLLSFSAGLVGEPRRTIQGILPRIAHSVYKKTCPFTADERRPLPLAATLPRPPFVNNSMRHSIRESDQLQPEPQMQPSKHRRCVESFAAGPLSRSVWRDLRPAARR